MANDFFLHIDGKIAPETWHQIYNVEGVFFSFQAVLQNIFKPSDLLHTLICYSLNIKLIQVTVEVKWTHDPQYL